MVCEQTKLNTGNIYWVLNDTPEMWQRQMLEDKQWGDDVFLQIAANVFNVNIVLVPLNPESAHHAGMYTQVQSIHGASGNDPLYMLYYEEWITAGHYQSIEPDPETEDNPLISYYNSRLKK